MRVATAVSCCLLLGGGMLAYGRWRLSQQTTTAGPVIGLVQQAFPISLSGRVDSAEKILTRHIEGSRRFGPKQADLVIWPETMLPTGLNAEMLDFDAAALSPAEARSLASRFFGPDAYDPKHSDETILASLIEALDIPSRRAQARRVGDLSRQLDCPILAGGTTIHRNLSQPVDEQDRWLMRNSVLLFDRSDRPSASYSKVHLVPFSESVPFKRSWLGLHKLLRRFVPSVMEQLEPGQAFSLFELTGNGGPWRLASPVCYEGTFARICRKMVMREGRKQVDILANLSNDGWFVYRKWGRGTYQPSTEHAQHLVQYCFRAIENRVPVVRAVNTGISASIDSNGRIVADVGLTLDGYRRRAMIAGTLLLDGAKLSDGEYEPNHGPRVLVDSRVSVYSLVGDVFAMCVSAAAIALVVRLITKRPIVGPSATTENKKERG